VISPVKAADEPLHLIPDGLGRGAPVQNLCQRSVQLHDGRLPRPWRGVPGRRTGNSAAKACQKDTTLVTW